jgi:glutaredoxin
MEDRKYFIVHGRTSCPFCVKAIALLEEKNINYIFSPMSGEYEVKIKEQYNWKTVPIVIERSIITGGDEILIGGYTDLSTYLEPTTNNGEARDLDSHNN